MAVNHLNFTIEKGKIYGFLGPNGAGKSTTMNMITGYIASTEGEILIDGHNLKNFNRMDLRELFGMVLQETWLFHGTIMENIRYGRLDATDEEVIAAAKAAHAHHFIMSQPGGYQMVLNQKYYVSLYSLLYRHFLGIFLFQFLRQIRIAHAVHIGNTITDQLINQ